MSIAHAWDLYLGATNFERKHQDIRTSLEKLWNIEIDVIILRYLKNKTVSYMRRPKKSSRTLLSIQLQKTH